MIYPVMGWFKIKQYDDKQESTTENITEKSGYEDIYDQRKLLINSEDSYSGISLNF